MSTRSTAERTSVFPVNVKRVRHTKERCGCFVAILCLFTKVVVHAHQVFEARCSMGCESQSGQDRMHRFYWEQVIHQEGQATSKLPANRDSLGE